MKKVLILLLFFNCIVFGNMRFNTSKLTSRKEIIGDWTQNINYTTNSFKITGLEDRKLIYEIENFGNIYFFREDGTVEERIKINKVELESFDSRLSRENKTIETNRRDCNLKLKVNVNVKGDSGLGGRYISRPITLTVYRGDGNKSSGIKIETTLELNVIRRLKVSTTPMDLGVGVQGQRVSSSQGTHGYLKVEGEPNKRINISYPKEIKIFNRKGKGSLKVNISSPELERKDDENYTTKLSRYGDRKILFMGEVVDTKKASPGKYSGELKIKVRYD